MKKENLRLKDMDQYITKTPLNMIEANKVFEMEHDGQRNFDIPFVYLAINTIKSLEKKGYDISMDDVSKASNYINIAKKAMSYMY